MSIFKVYKDRSFVNKKIYLSKSKLPRTKNQSTFNTRKVLKDRELRFKPLLADIVYSSGFSRSFKDAKHMVLNNTIQVNDVTVTSPNLKIKSGDIIRCIDSRTLLSYYMQRWNCIEFTDYDKRGLGKVDRDMYLLLTGLKKTLFNPNAEFISKYLQNPEELDLSGIRCASYREWILICGKMKLKKYLSEQGEPVKKGKVMKGGNSDGRVEVKKYKFMLGNSRIHRLCYNSIVWV